MRRLALAVRPHTSCTSRARGTVRPSLRIAELGLNSVLVVRCDSDIGQELTVLVILSLLCCLLYLLPCLLLSCDGSQS
jgi:hypothetical protein